MTVIVGAGLSGLALAEELSRRGDSVTLLEASARGGGLLDSPRVEGFLLEDAANSFIDREPHTREVLKRLGLEGSVRPATPASQRRFLFTRGALQELPRTPPQFLRSPVLPLAAKLRALLEPLSRRRISGSGDESVASFFRRHLGERVTRTLVDAMQSGIYAGDPERLSLPATFPKLDALERDHRSLLLGTLRAARAPKNPGTLTGETCTFEGGISTLTAALAREVGAALRPGTTVTGLERSGKGFQVHCQTGSGDLSEETGRLVLATPSFVTAELVRPLAPELAEELAHIRYAPVAVVHLGFAAGALAVPPEGFGVLIPEEEKLPLLGIIFVSSTFPFRAPAGATLLTCIVGGARHPEWLEGDVVGRTLTAIGQVLGIHAAPSLTRVVRWPQGIPQYDVGHLARLSRIDAAVAKIPGLFLTGNAYHGVGLHDCLRSAARLGAVLRPD